MNTIVIGIMRDKLFLPGFARIIPITMTYLVLFNFNQNKSMFTPHFSNILSALRKRKNLAYSSL